MKVVKGKMIKMKIALVKQDVYQDLYVGNKDMSLVELLYSSAGRVGCKFCSNGTPILKSAVHSF